MKSGSRFQITDLETGKKVDVEVIQPRRRHRAEFGDSLSEDCDGAIQDEDSMISEETHDNVRFVKNPSEIFRKK